MTDIDQATSTRTIWNPIQRDAATFLVTSAESGGTVTRLEIELAAGGGNELHVHRSYTEHFQVLEGQLGVQVARERRVLRPGEQAVVPAGTPHRFFSIDNQPARFIVELRPGHAGMERALRIAYGLARDGLTNSRGIPRNFLHLALTADLSDIALTGPMALLNPVLRFAARIARARGVEAELLRRYCPAEADAPAPALAGV
jgi:mannose-6-phosphate isomerase-like protein (cupin superfamily)